MCSYSVAISCPILWQWPLYYLGESVSNCAFNSSCPVVVGVESLYIFLLEVQWSRRSKWQYSLAFPSGGMDIVAGALIVIKWHSTEY